MDANSHPILSPLEELFLRWIAAVALVVGTYNPSQFSFVHWAMRADAHQLPYPIFTGTLIILGFLVFLRATWHSIGFPGLALLVILSSILAVGLDCSTIRSKISGQIDAEAR